MKFIQSTVIAFLSVLGVYNSSGAYGGEEGLEPDSPLIAYFTDDLSRLDRDEENQLSIIAGSKVSEQDLKEILFEYWNKNSGEKNSNLMRLVDHLHTAQWTDEAGGYRGKTIKTCLKSALCLPGIVVGFSAAGVGSFLYTTSYLYLILPPPFSLAPHVLQGSFGAGLAIVGTGVGLASASVLDSIQKSSSASGSEERTKFIWALMSDKEAFESQYGELPKVVSFLLNFRIKDMSLAVKK